MKTIPKTSEWLKAHVAAPPIGVDREAHVIRGFVMAQEGPFRTEGRGEFDIKGLREIVKLTNAKNGGLKSRFAHPSLSGDGIGTFLGRVRNAKMGVVQIERDGERLERNAVRGDLFLDKTAFSSPHGDLGNYVMDLAESDSGAMSSSLDLKPDKRMRLDKQGRPSTDDNGNELPPLWFPLEIHASDLVDEGDAVDGFLSVENLDDALVRKGCSLLQQFLPGQPREVVEARLQAWLQEALRWRFGDEPEAEDPSATANFPEIGDKYPEGQSEPAGASAEDLERALRFSGVSG